MREEPAAPIPGELERAFQDHSSLVFRTAYRVTGNAADAEDVLQTVFLRPARLYFPRRRSKTLKVIYGEPP